MYGGQSSYLPMKVNMSGVLPIIFAQSIASLPVTIWTFIGTPAEGTISRTIYDAIDTQSFIYMVVYFIMIIGFSYFYSTIQFNPVEIANNLKKQGGFIPGFRPGKPTVDFIKKVLSKITLFGAIYLGIVAICPLLLGKSRRQLPTWPSAEPPSSSWWAWPWRPSRPWRPRCSCVSTRASWNKREGVSIEADPVGRPRRRQGHTGGDPVQRAAHPHHLHGQHPPGGHQERHAHGPEGQDLYGRGHSWSPTRSSSASSRSGWRRTTARTAISWTGCPAPSPRRRLMEKAGITFDAVVSIEIADETIMDRMSGRRVCESCGASYHVVAVPPKQEGVAATSAAASWSSGKMMPPRP